MPLSTIDVLEQLEAVSGRNDKEDILESNARNEGLKAIFVAALDPYTTYGIKKWTTPKPGSTPCIEKFVRECLPRLASRTKTGNAARAEVEAWFGHMPALEQKWAKRILLKNLRCGVQEKTVNRVWPGAIVPFTVQLANSIEAKCEGNKIEILDEIRYPVWCESKLDGLRCVVIKSKGEVKLYTRNGNEIDTVPSVARAWEPVDADDFVVDSECMGTDWAESASVISSNKSLKDDANMRCHAFDTMSLDEWKAHRCDRKHSDRLSQLRSLLKKLPSGSPIVAVKGKLCRNEAELLAFYEECLDAGFEGIMVKDSDGLYEFKRTNAMRKLKPIATAEGVVVATYGSRVGTKREGLFAGFEVVFPNGVVTRVGSGFSDKLKADIQLEGQETYIGRIVEVESQPPMTDDGKLRFPRLKRFRDRKDVDPAVWTAYEQYTR